MNDTKIKNVCIVNNMYALLIYLLIMSEEEYHNTFYFFGNNIPDQIANKFVFYKKYKATNNYFSKILFALKIRFFDKKKYKFIKTANIYGQDNLRITTPLIGIKRMTVLEDGVANYTLSLPTMRIRNLFWWLINGSNRGGCLGYSEFTDKIILTGIAPVPEKLKNKVVLINLSKQWNKKSFGEQCLINQIFGIEEHILNDFIECKSILLTQPLSEDRIISEKEKILLYRKIINNRIMAIKPHPREKTNYRNYFLHSIILPSHVPMELLTLNGIKFDEVDTIFSTAALGFPYKCKVHFWGTVLHPALIKKYGLIEYKNGRLVKKIK